MSIDWSTLAAIRGGGGGPSHDPFPNGHGMAGQAQKLELLAQP